MNKLFVTKKILSLLKLPELFTFQLRICCLPDCKMLKDTAAKDTWLPREGDNRWQ